MAKINNISKKKFKISVSLLSANFYNLCSQIKDIENSKADEFHFDVMDGHFVPNITIGPEVINKLRKYTSLPFDVHLMISPVHHFIKNFAEAGADILFVEAPESISELEQIGKELSKPILANMADRGKTPIMNKLELENMGFSIAIFPGLGMLAAGGALSSAYAALLRDGTSAHVDANMMELTEMHNIMGFQEVWDFERKWARDN